ncbi:hypothetical protein Goarm_022950, partial [Gossypium armourianum]|nr:hypothetical protein [Gossypium armourianum]
MAATRFDIEKFDGVTNFNMWQALSAIQLCVTNKVLQEVLMDKTSSALWK